MEYFANAMDKHTQADKNMASNLWWWAVKQKKHLSVYQSERAL